LNTSKKPVSEASGGERTWKRGRIQNGETRPGKRIPATSNKEDTKKTSEREKLEQKSFLEGENHKEKERKRGTEGEKKKQ